MTRRSNHQRRIRRHVCGAPKSQRLADLRRLSGAAYAQTNHEHHDGGMGKRWQDHHCCQRPSASRHTWRTKVAPLSSPDKTRPSLTCRGRGHVVWMARRISCLVYGQTILDREPRSTYLLGNNVESQEDRALEPRLQYDFESTLATLS